MKINTVTYYIKDAFKSLKRNKTISVASMITVFITFFVLGIFLLVGNNISSAIDEVQDKVDLKIILSDDARLVDQREIEIKLNDIQGVEEVEFKSKEDEFNEFNTKENEGLMKGYSLQHNPFTGSFTVKLNSPEDAKNVTDAVKNMQGVDKVSGQQEVVDKIISFVKGVRSIGGVLFTVLVGVSIFLIMNTTKLTVFSRRREVGIMKFVGATDWFIRWPFIIEGIVIGLVGATFSFVSLFFLYKGVFSFLSDNLPFVNLVPVTYILQTMSWQFILGGIVVGGIASGLSLRKFLEV